MTDFPSQVNVQPAPGIAGDFASANPRASFLAGPGGMIAGAAGLTVGLFCWASYLDEDADYAPAVLNNFGSGPVAGFVHRDQQGLITQYLGAYSNVIVPGNQAGAMIEGDFWVVNNGAAEAVPGMKAYANYANGQASFAASGSPGSASATGVITAQTSSVTGSIAGNIMTVTAVASGTVYPGTTVSGTGVASGSIVVGQELPLLAGEALGGVGRYALSIGEQTVASTTISGTYGLLTISGTVTGTFSVGDTLSGTGVVTGTAITALGTGTGGDGTYVVNNNTAVSSTTISAGTTVETKWYCRSSGAVGEVVKISSWPIG